MSSESHSTSTADRVRRLLEVDRTTLPPDGGPRYNRLIFAASPYLLQHAENPVDWYPWGDEAFERARAEDKPLLVSIGYATCHWCHVMEHESFEDREVAEAINRNCVAVKVDREERPDIDDQYMLAARMMTGSGGWPLNVIMTPDRRPFFAATYLPRHSRRGLPGIMELLDTVGRVWRDQRGKVTESCSAIAAALAQAGVPEPGELPGHELLADAAAQIASLFDADFGGFGGAPKFPMPVYLSFLLRVHARSGEPLPLAMAEATLKAIRSGGVYDQLGFGLHRYAVDREWLVPHFEKMLYDQALVALAATEAYQATGDDRYRRMAAEILTYVQRDLAAPDGGFFSAEDADTEAVEGTYYLWTPQELTAVLGEHEGVMAARLFGVTPGGNFEGRNILSLPEPPEAFAERSGIVPELLAADLERWRLRLLGARQRRERPFRDEKIITAWNGLAVAALARGYAATGETAWRAAAERALAFISTRLVSPAGRLLRSHHRDEATIPGFLEDYACLVWGLIELHQATLEQSHLDEAVRLTGEMLRLFGDGEGGLYDTGSDGERLPVRMRSGQDNVTPAGASVAALNLLRLGRIADDDDLKAAGEALLRSCMGSVQEQPLGYLFLLTALDAAHGPWLEAGIAGGTPAERTAMLRTLGRRYLPGLAIREAPGDGALTVHICAAGACRPPVSSVAELEALLDGLGE